MQETRQNKIARLLQKELSVIFQEQTRGMHGVMVSVTRTKISPDLSICTAYLSIFPSERGQELLANIEKTLNSLGTNTTEVLQMASDSGLEITDLLQIYSYLTTPATPAASANKGIFEGAEIEKRQIEVEPYLIDYYQGYLTNWLKENHVNIYDQAE